MASRFSFQLFLFVLLQSRFCLSLRLPAVGPKRKALPEDKGLPKTSATKRENALEYIAVHQSESNFTFNKSFIELKVNVSELSSSGAWLEVSWSGSYTPSYWDYIALMIPAEADVRRTAPAKYKLTRFATRSSGDGRPMLTFRVINMRQAFRFVLFTNGLEYPVAIASSSVVEFRNYNEPTQGHLALTGKPREMRVQWVTRDVGRPMVRWGRSPDSLSLTAAAGSTTYTRDDLCGEPATSVGWVSPGTMHSAVLRGLEPGVRYFYTYGDEEFGFSPVRSFVGPPLPGASGAVHLLHVADMGQAEVDGSNELSMMAPSLNTTALMASDLGRLPYGLVIHNGDISYARGFVTQWDVFYDQIEGIATRVPWMTSPGNHERDYPFSGDRFDSVFDSGGECGVPYEKRTGMPHPAEGQQWYSFDYGPIHFLEMSTEQPFAPGTPQFRFISEDLAGVDRAVTPWLVVGAHRPFYVSSSYSGPKDSDLTVSKDLRDALEDLFVEHQVDTVWTGHHHSYQRTCPVYKSKCVESGGSGGYAAPVYLVAGHAGANLCAFGDRQEYMMAMHREWGYMRITANRTDMEISVIRDSDGTEMDHISLRKPITQEPAPSRVTKHTQGLAKKISASTS